MATAKEIKENARARDRALRERHEALKAQPETDLQALLGLQTDLLFEILGCLRVMRSEMWDSTDAILGRIIPPPPPLDHHQLTLALMGVNSSAESMLRALLGHFHVSYHSSLGDR